jgi:hypothetical protein
MMSAGPLPRAASALGKGLLQYRYKPNHRVSAAVYLRLQLASLAHAVSDTAVRPQPDSDAFCFVTGCGHGGTTLLASKLGLHPDVLLISRESNIFAPQHGLRLARVIVQEWLAFARQEQRRVILEKSPKHVHCIGRIRRLLPESRIIVVVRNPLDTCASLFKRFGNLDLVIERWLMDNEAALEAQAGKATLLVRYEALTRTPAATLSAACSFLGLPWDPGLLERSGSAYGSDPGLRRNMAIRHEQVSQPIYDNNGKWAEVLTSEQATRVRQRTAGLAVKLGYPDGTG